MIAFFDTETTGLPNKRARSVFEQPHVLQLAVSLYDEERRPVFELSTLVGIAPNVRLEEKAFETHRISGDLSRQYGVNKKQAIGLIRFAFERASRVVAHNLQFDRNLLTFETEREELPNLFTGRDCFCTMEALTPILQLPATEKMLKYGYGPYKNPNLGEAYRHFFQEALVDAHDALVDTRACARVYFEMVDRGLIPS